MSNTGLCLAFACFLMIGGCVQVGSGKPAPIVVNVRSEGGECRVRVARASYNQPPTFIRVNQTQLLQIAREAKGRRAIVVFDLNAQYKCIGATVITMQEGGLMVDLAGWDNR